MSSDEFTYWLNGSFVPASEAVIPINSRGYRLGDGIFDTERTFNGKLFRLKEHLERLDRSLKYTRMNLGMSLDELGEIAEEVARRNAHLLEKYGDFWVTQTVSRGNNNDAFVSMIVEPLTFFRFAPYYTKGVPLVIPSGRTASRQALDPKLKATSRLNLVLADLEGKQVDPDSLSLLMDEDGNLTEVIYGNLFIVRGGRIYAPSSKSILEGVTRMTTMELAEKINRPVTETNLQPYDLATADEAFVTTTSYVVMPVRSMNGQPVGTALPGPVTQEMTQAWRDLVGLDFVAQMQTYAEKGVQSAPTIGIAAR